MIPDDLINPFKVSSSAELPFAKPIGPGENALWTEHVFFFGFDPHSKLGISCHGGRHPSDTAMWRMVVLVYLPDNEILVGKFSGRDGHRRGPGAGPFQASCIEPFRLWSVDFDGLLQRTSRESLMGDTHRDTSTELVDFHLVFEAAAPYWDMYQNAESRSKQSWSASHYEQICLVRGSVRLKGESIEFSGAGVRDHSAGPRDYAPVVGLFWMNAYFPQSGTAMMGMFARSETAGSEINQGYIFRNDGRPLEVVRLREFPVVTALDTPLKSVNADPVTAPDLQKFVVELETKAGIERVEGELMHGGATSYISPSHEVLGTSFVPGALQLTDSATIFKWNGQQGVGNRERIVRTSLLR